MRSSLSLLFVSAFSITALGCTSDLWSRYVRDTEDSCLRVGCPSGGSCNASTGLCEGATDMGPGDIPTPSQDYFFGAPVPINPTSLYEGESYYQMAAMLPESRSSTPEIWLSGPTQMLTRLFQTGGSLAYGASPLKLEEQPCFLTSIEGNARGQRDLLAGQLAQKFSRVIGTQPSTFSTTISGFKLISVGDLDRDGFPDAVVTASKLSLANLYYKSYPNSTGDGQAELYLGDSSYQLQGKSNNALTGPLISVTIEHQGTRLKSAFNVGVIGAGRETTAVLAQVSVVSGAPSFTVNAELAVPPSDFAIPVDVNGDGLNDLVLIQLWDGNSPFMGPTGAVYIAHNSGLEGKPIFLPEHMAQVGLSPGLVLTAKVEDFDQDSFPDLAVVSATLTGGEVQYFHNEPLSTTTKDPRRQLRYIGKMSNNHAGRAVEFIDLNRDGCKDALMLFSGGMGATATGTSLLWAPGKKAGRGLPDCF